MKPDPAPSLRGYLRLLWRRRWSLVIPVVAAAGVAGGLASRQAPVYESVAELVFEGSALGGAPAAQAEDMALQARIATGPQVTARAAERLGEGTTPQSVAEAVRAEQVQGLPVLRLRARHPSPQQASALASAVVNAYQEHRTLRAGNALVAAEADLARRRAELDAELQRVEGELAAAADAAQAQQLQGRRDLLVGQLALEQSRLAELRAQAVAPSQTLSVLVPASLPDAPVAPRPLRAGAIGALVGLLVGFGLALAREQLDERLRSTGEVEALLNAPVLASIPRLRRRRGRGGPILLTEPTSPAAEAYRILRAGLAASGAGSKHGVVLVTSALPEEGKSTTAANLGVAFAEAGTPTVLVDADLRRPRLHELFGLANDQGLGDLLQQRPSRIANVGTARLRSPLSLLPAGRCQGRPTETLAAPRLAALLARLRDDAGVVIVDTPPALPVADAAMLAGHADAVVVVVKPGIATRAAVDGLRARLAPSGATVLGVVLNMPEGDLLDEPYGNYPSAYRYRPRREADPVTGEAG